ncbi:MAG TPA: DUF493 domain-containing protein [Gammaproteobacteria bacterium]|nr:DUF493 domain-containing protein [Gammaproteobacteria bacterium]
MSRDEDSPLEFPCDFAIKVMGRQSEEFEQHVHDVLRRHFAAADILDTRRRNSRGANYLSLTVTVRAGSRAQLDEAYRELTASEHVLMAL